MLSTPLARLRTIGFLEGISFLVLIGIAMPLKYAAGRPEAVSVVGAVHGALFVLYVLAVAHVMFVRRWSIERALVAVIAAVVPFGPFVFDRSLRREEQEGTPAVAR
jgi:integral membrane protein